MKPKTSKAKLVEEAGEFLRDESVTVLVGV